MKDVICRVLTEMIETVEKPVDRLLLEDVRRVAEMIAAIASPEDRRTIIGVLKHYENLASIADDVAMRKIVPFPSRDLRAAWADEGGHDQ